MKKIFLLSMMSLLTIVFTGCDSKEKELERLKREKQLEIERSARETDRFLKDAEEASKNSERAIQENFKKMEEAERRRKINEFMSKCRNCNGTGVLPRAKYSGGTIRPGDQLFKVQWNRKKIVISIHSP